MGTKMVFSPGYPDHFQTAMYITAQGQLCLYGALNCTYLMNHWFCPIRLIHLISSKSLYFEEKKTRLRKAEAPRKNPVLSLFTSVKLFHIHGRIETLLLIVQRQG